jgi:chemotaxis protein MotB
MAAKRSRRKHEEEAENNERWLVSYADFITLLFAFFVTMYAISRVDGNKLGSAVESLQRALGSVISIQSSQSDPGLFPQRNQPLSKTYITPVSAGQSAGKGHLSPSEVENFEKMAREIRKKLETLAQQEKGEKGVGLKTMSMDQIKFIIEKRGLVIRVSERLFFDSGDASVRPEFIPLLNVLGTTLQSIPNQIRIEGHTDSVPINTPRFPSNWELSTARATTIIRYLLTHFEFNKEQLSATGYAEFRPIDSNGTTEGRLQNRRVDFVILGNREMETEPQGDTETSEGKEKI